MDAVSFVLLCVSNNEESVDDLLDACELLLGEITMPPAPTPSQIKRSVTKVGKKIPTLLEAINLAHITEGSGGRFLNGYAHDAFTERQFVSKEIATLNLIFDHIIEVGVRIPKTTKVAPTRSRLEKADGGEEEYEETSYREIDYSEGREPAPAPPRPKPKAKPKAKPKNDYSRFVSHMSALGYPLKDITKMWRSLGEVQPEAQPVRGKKDYSRQPAVTSAPSVRVTHRREMGERPRYREEGGNAYEKTDEPETSKDAGIAESGQLLDEEGSC